MYYVSLILALSALCTHSGSFLFDFIIVQVWIYSVEFYKSKCEKWLLKICTHGGALWLWKENLTNKAEINQSYKMSQNPSDYFSMSGISL